MINCSGYQMELECFPLLKLDGKSILHMAREISANDSFEALGYVDSKPTATLLTTHI